jgi:hypothetical protein
VLTSTQPEDPSDGYRALLALLVLSVNPSKLPSFPSLASHFPSAGSTLPETWQNRFTDRLHTCTPLEQAEAAKFTLRRLDSGTVGPIIDIAYRQFARAERNAGYPADAYKSYAGALTHAELKGVFEVWADLTARAPVECMLGGKVALLWAWWLMYVSPSRRDQQGEGKIEWDGLYEQWETAGKRMQHLFYAWIR